MLGASVTVTFSYADGWYAYTIDGQTMKRAYEEETLRSRLSVLRRVPV